MAEIRLKTEPQGIAHQTRLIDLISEVCVTSGFSAAERDMILRVNARPDLEVVVDPHLFTSALANLVQNAIKFSSRGSTIEIRAIEVNGRILIQVEDACGGLPKGKAEELFEVGVQKSEDRSGLGLGLAISRRAIERDGGQLTVENLPGKGCIFTINLPCVAPSANQKGG